MPPVSEISGLPGPVGCGGAGEVTGGLPEPSPPQADEKIAAVTANKPNPRAEFAKEMKFKIRDIANDSQDSCFSMTFSPALACVIARTHASVKIVSAY